MTSTTSAPMRFHNKSWRKEVEEELLLWKESHEGQSKSETPDSLLSEKEEK